MNVARTWQRTVTNISIWIATAIAVAGCGAATTNFSSERSVGSSVYLTLSSADVAFDGTQLVGTVTLKAANGAGQAVSGFTPTVTVASSTSTQSVFSLLKAKLNQAALSLGLVSEASVQYTILPCSASDASGAAVCLVKVASGSGTLKLQVSGAATPTPLIVDLTFYASPTLTAVAPLQVDAGSATTQLTLTGTGFRSPMTVLAGNLTCSAVQVTSSTSATCTLPATTALGLLDVKVTNADNQFYYLRSAVNVRDRFAPAITVSAAPATLTKNAADTVTFNVSDNAASLANLSIVCTLDSVTTACSPPTLSLSGIADGLHNLVISATDPSNNSSSQTLTWTVDTVPPALTFDNSGLGSTPSASAATRSVSVGGVGVVSYKAVVIRSGVCAAADFSAAAETLIANPFTLNITTDGTYTICGIGKDAAGNWQAAASSTSSATLTIDTTIPYIVSITGNLTSPTSDATALDLTMNGNGVAAYKAVTLKNAANCSGADFSAVTESAVGVTYSLAFSGEGTYFVCAIGRNAANTWQPTPTMSSAVTLDTTPPTLNAISLGASPSNSAATRSIMLSGTGVVQYKAISYTSGSCDTTALGAAAAQPISQAFSLAITLDATYQVCAIGKDAAGNWQASPTVSSALAVDTLAPALTFTAPALGTAANTGVTVQGSCETGLTVTLAGSGLSAPVTTACTNSAFAQALTFASGEGSKTISAWQTDAAGNVGTVTTSFVKDTAIPAITITGPAANTSAISGVTLSGTCEPGLSIALSGTGLASPASATCNNGVFSQAVVFQPGNGTKNIVVTQTDAAGNVGTDNRDFIEDNNAPTLALSTPAANTPAKTGLTLTGVCEDGLSIVLGGAGLASPATATCSSGTFSQAITFSAGDGVKTVTLSQTDSAGNNTTVSRDFLKDTTPPLLAFTTGVQNQYSNGNAAAFSGTCEAGLTVSVTFNSAGEGTTTCTSDSTWSYSSATQTTDGARTYTFTETDAAGNLSTVSGTWTRDATPPTLSLTQPTAGLIFSGGATTNIQWTTADANLAAVPIWIEYTTNGGTSWATISASLMNTGSYTWTIPGINTANAQVRITSSDTYGNRTSVISPAFTIDSSPPVVTLTSLTGGQLVKGGSSRAITWTATDNNMATNPITLAYSDDGGTNWTAIASGQANSGSYSWTVPTTSGTSYLVRVTAVDLASHSAQAVSASAFAVDATNPALSNVTVNGQSAGAIVAATATATIAWTASDANFGAYPIALSYSTNGGSTWTTITSAVANSPSAYSWNLAPLGLGDGSTYQVRVVATDSVGNATTLATGNFSVLASAPALTFADGTNTNAYVNGDTVTYSGACTNGYSVIITGTDGTNTSVACNSGMWTWTTPSAGADGAVTYTFAQNNGAYTTNVSATWTRDTAAPTIGSVVINGGQTATALSNLKVDVTVGSEANLSGLKVQLALANIISQVCPSAGSNWQSFPAAASGRFDFSLTAPPGQKTVCVWLKDAAGNTSSVATGSITFNNGTPPSITAFSVSNGVASSNFGTSAYAAGDTVNITWTITDAEGLSTNPVYLDYTLDGSTWTTIASGYGDLTGNPTTYTGSFTGFSSPAGFFEIRIRAQDLSGNWAVPLVSTPQNAAPWTVFAGSTDRGVGSGATTAFLGGTLYGGGLAVINPNNNDIYAIDRGRGIVKIPSSTGIVSQFMTHSTTVNLSNGGGSITPASTMDTANGGMVWDGGYIYMLTGNGTAASSKIWRINPTDNTYTLYFGGGTDTSTSASATTAFVMFDAFRFDEDHSLYFFSSCASPTSSYNSATSTVKLMKVTQTAAGTPGTISAVAGNCVNGTPVSGTAATATPLGDGANVGTSALAVWNHGNMIYYRLHAQATTYKIVNGTLYSTAIVANTATDLAYSPLTSKLYVAAAIVYAYTPTATANGETSTVVLTNAGTGTSCFSDGVVASTAACSTTYRIIVDGNGQLVVLDGSGGTNRPYRIRYVDGNGKIWTLAGSLPFYGNGLNPLYSRGTYKGIYYKPSTAPNLTAFPSGLYFTDPQAPVFGLIANGTTSVLWGNQSGLCASSSYAAGVTISSGLTAGCAFGAPSNLGNLSLGFDSTGLPWLRPTWAGLLYLDATLHPTYLNTGTSTVADTTNWMLASTSATASSLSYFMSAPNNMTIKSSSTRRGFFSLGAYNSASPWTYAGPVLRFFDFTNNSVVHIMGTTATAAATVDSATAGTDTLTNATISASCQFQNGTGCYTQFVENDPTTDSDDVLYFTEGTKLRSITNPFNPGSQTLKTIFTEASTLGNFIPTPDNHRIYYLMGGYLYCYALSKDYESADCMNRKADVTTLAAVNAHNHGPLGPPSGMAAFPTTVQADSMTWKDAKTLLIANGQQVYQYNVPQPNSTTQNLAYGVNLHANAAYGSGNTAAIAAQMQLLQARGLRAVRLGSFNNTIAKNQLDAAATYGLKSTFIIELQWIVNLNDGKTFTTTDPTTLYNNAYNYTYNLLLGFKDYENVDWEMGNEIDLKAGAGGPAAWNSGWTAAAWTGINGPGSADYFTSWSHILRGASDAIATVNTQYGKHHRRILNFVGTNKGFLDFMISKGVNFDMISYHSYYSRGVSMYSLPAAQPGYGVGYWNLFSALASYNRPIQITETNCGEIYNAAYQNVSTDPLWATCLSNLRVQLGYYKNNSQINLESVFAYELYDEPAAATPENRFGLLFNSGNTTYTPKTHLLLFSAFAGGTLSAAETNELNSFGLLPVP